MDEDDSRSVSSAAPASDSGDRIAGVSASRWGKEAKGIMHADALREWSHDLMLTVTVLSVLIRY